MISLPLIKVSVDVSTLWGMFNNAYAFNGDLSSDIGCIPSTDTFIKGMSLPEYAIHRSDIGCIPSTNVIIK